MHGSVNLFFNLMMEEEDKNVASSTANSLPFVANLVCQNHLFLFLFSVRVQYEIIFIFNSFSLSFISSGVQR